MLNTISLKGSENERSHAQRRRLVSREVRHSVSKTPSFVISVLECFFFVAFEL